MGRLKVPPRVSTPGEVMLARADPPGRRYKANPTLWAKERAGIDLWSKQSQIMNSVRDNYETMVHSCHEVGKSFTAATAVCWWLDVHPPGEARVVTTAPTQPQVEAILWHEINKIHERAELLGRTNLTEWYIGKQLVAFGRKPSDYNQSAFQGVHARYFLVVLDEACGIPKNLWDAASTLAANEHSRILAIGNPDDRNTEFGDNCKTPDPTREIIKIGYRDTPNFTGEPVSQHVADSLIHPHWVESRRRKWGEDSALFMSKCEGEFSELGDPFSTIPYAWAAQCRWNELPATGDVEAGIDIGGGGDRTVVQLRRGARALEQFEFVDADPMKTVGRIAQILAEHSVRRAKVDSIGIGWGVYGRLRELSSTSNPYGEKHSHAAEVIPINFSESPPAGFGDRYLNMRAYVHWEVGRENSRLKLWDLTQLDDDTIHELTASRYEIVDSSGMVKIEAKDKIIKRLGFSPDRSDALLLAFTRSTWEVQLPPMDAMTTDLLRDSGPRDIWRSGAHEDIFGSAERGM